jgi:hypothetical protein
MALTRPDANSANLWSAFTLVEYLEAFLTATVGVIGSGAGQEVILMK